MHSNTLLQAKNLFTLKEAKRALVGNILLALIVAYLLYTVQLPFSVISAWFLSMLIISTLRITYIYHFLPKLQAKDENLNQAALYFYSNSYFLLLALLWSIAYLLIILHGDSTLDNLVIAIVIGFAGASIYSSANSYKTFFLLNMPPIITVFISILVTQQEAIFSLSILVLASLFITNAALGFNRYFDDNLYKTETLKKSHNEIIRALGRAGEYRDEETGNHVLRMSYSCYLMAKELNHNEAYAQRLQNAAKLHDLGKIGIPDRILLKQGKLTDQERAIMQEHVEIGVQILSTAQSSHSLKLAQSIALTHHERWDGTGYPNQLKGEAIPIEGRIACLSDVYDALTSDRPYKDAWSEEKATQFLLDNAGKMFDPKLVPIFIRIIPEIERYRTLNPDSDENYLVKYEAILGDTENTA